MERNRKQQKISREEGRFVQREYYVRKTLHSCKPHSSHAKREGEGWSAGERERSVLSIYRYVSIWREREREW